MLLSDDTSIAAGGVAAARIAAAGCRCCRSRCCCSAAAGVAAVKGGGGPPVRTEVIGQGRWCGKIVWVIVGTCGSWAGPRNPERKKNANQTYDRSHTVFLHLLEQDNTWACLGPSNQRAAPRKWRAGQCITRVSWASLAMSCAGPGRADISETLMGRTVKFCNSDEPDRSAAHHMKN